MSFAGNIIYNYVQPQTLIRVESCTSLCDIREILFCTDITFRQQTYSVREDEGILTVTVERYGDTEGHIVALIATHPTEGTANGKL